jgi:hypothetical protein
MIALLTFSGFLRMITGIDCTAPRWQWSDLEISQFVPTKECLKLYFLRK